MAPSGALARYGSGPETPQDGLKTAQDGQRRSQDGPRPPNTAPRAPQEPPKTHRDPPNCPEPIQKKRDWFSYGFCTFLKILPNRPKTPHDRPKTAPIRPKTAPRQTQDGPTWPLDGLDKAPGRPHRPSETQNIAPTWCSARKSRDRTQSPRPSSSIGTNTSTARCAKIGG